jgi:hypothetical protein
MEFYCCKFMGSWYKNYHKLWCNTVNICKLHKIYGLTTKIHKLEQLKKLRSCKKCMKSWHNSKEFFLLSLDWDFWVCTNFFEFGLTCNVFFGLPIFWVDCLLSSLQIIYHLYFFVQTFTKFTAVSCKFFSTDIWLINFSKKKIFFFYGTQKELAVPWHYWFIESHSKVFIHEIKV